MNTRRRSPGSPAPTENTKKKICKYIFPPRPPTFKRGFEKQNRTVNLNNQNRTPAEFYTKLKSDFFILRHQDLQTTTVRSEHKLPTELCLLPPSRKNKIHFSNPSLPAEPLQAQPLPKPTVLCGIAEVSLILQALQCSIPVPYFSSSPILSLLILNPLRGIQPFLPVKPVQPIVPHNACPLSPRPTATTLIAKLRPHMGMRLSPSRALHRHILPTSAHPAGLPWLFVPKQLLSHLHPT